MGNIAVIWEWDGTVIKTHSYIPTNYPWWDCKMSVKWVSAQL